jgi:hypothetical protein
MDIRMEVQIELFLAIAAAAAPALYSKRSRFPLRQRKTSPLKRRFRMSAPLNLEKCMEINIKEANVNDLICIRRLSGIDLNRPLPERLKKITDTLGNPYAYISSAGIKVKINHIGERTVDDALLEHFTGVQA